MQIYQGTTRTVIVIPLFGIAIKFARVHPILFFRVLMYGLKNKKTGDSFFSTLRKMSKREKVGLDRFWDHLFGGFVSNLREYSFGVRCGIFVAPVYFSCGFFSIVRHAKSLHTQRMEFGRKTQQALFSIVPYKDLMDDAHHWANEDNFGLLNGRVVMCDFGSTKTQSILRKYGRQIDSLDLASVMQKTSPDFSPYSR